MPDESTAPGIGPAPSPVSHATKLDDLVQKLRSTPLFMTDLDDAGEDNPAVEALKSLAYDEPPEQMAQTLKTEGNEQFKLGNYREAAKFYSRALDYDGHENRALKVSLLTNRAAANLELHNYARVLEDCAEALRREPKTSKALFRSAKACLALEKFDEARECCRWALEVDAQNKEVERLMAQVDEKQKAFEKKTAEREQREAARERQRAMLMEAIEIRQGLTFDSSRPLKKGGLPWDADSPRQAQLDEASGHLLWPVFFLYPEAKESDFVERFDEMHTLRDMLEVVLAEPPAWDDRARPKYTVHNVDTFFLHRPVGGFDEDERLVKVGINTRLATVLQHEKYVIRDGIPSFVVLPRNDPFTDQFIDRYRKLRQAKEAATKKC